MDYAKELFSSFWHSIDLPAMMMVSMMVLFVYVLVQIQKSKDNDFNFADLFLDDNKKASVGRMMSLVSGGVSSWVIMYMVIHDSDSKIDPVYYGIFVGVWSGQRVAEKLIDAWAGNRGGKNDNGNDNSGPTTTTTTVTKVE